jgi:hypothetical protein
LEAALNAFALTYADRIPTAGTNATSRILPGEGCSSAANMR